MGFKGKATSSGGNGDQSYEIPPQDNQPAVLVAIVDLGTQHVDGYQGAAAKDVHQVYLVWELTDAQVSGTSFNHVIGSVYTVSYHEKASLRLMLEAWKGQKYADGADMDVALAIGQSCLLNVVHATSKNSGKTYAKVKGIAKLPKGMPKPSAKYAPFVWELEGDADPRELPAWLPYIYGEKVIEVVERAKEFTREPVAAGATAADTPGDANEEEVAF